MDKKYLGKAVMLPVAAAQDVERIRQALHVELGFKPSMSETIVVMTKHWDETRRKPLTNATMSEKMLA